VSDRAVPDQTVRRDPLAGLFIRGVFATPCRGVLPACITAYLPGRRRQKTI